MLQTTKSDSIQQPATCLQCSTSLPVVTFASHPEGGLIALRQRLFQPGFKFIVGCTPIPTYPYGKSLYKPYISLNSGCLWVIIPKNPYISPISTMGTLLGVHLSLSLEIGVQPPSLYTCLPVEFKQLLILGS